MTPKAKEQRSAGELDDTCTRRKRSRRVSFAETTVHVFNRDDESESPANSTPVPIEGCGLSDNERTVGFGGIKSHGDDSVESAPEDEGEDGARLSFVRNFDLSSPGSAVGSVTSNEDDNFFGPVSTSFINSGHLSESGMPDDNNHDITLDSTAFSLHFRNIVPPDDQSANSAGSLRAPTGDRTPTMPRGFLVGSDQTEELSTKRSVGQMSNASVDWIKINPNIGGSHSYNYGRLSLTLEALMNEVNMKMQHKSSIGDCRLVTSSCQTDEFGGNKKLCNDGEEVGNQISCSDEPGRIICCSASPIGPPISNELLLHAKPNTLTSHSNSEKIKEMFSPLFVDRFGKGHEASHPEIVITSGQNSNLLSPSHGGLPDDLNGQACHVHQELNRSPTSEGKSYSDSFLHSISVVQSMSDDVKQKLELANIAHTPKNDTKSFHSSALQEMTPMPSLFSQEQQHFFSQTAPPSSKFLSNSASAFRMETPDNAVKAFGFSSSKASSSSFQVKRTQLLDSSVISKGGLMHDAARQQSVSLRRELMEHGERISTIKNHITRSNVKSRMLSEYGPAPSSKDLFVTFLQSTQNDISYDSCMKHAGISDVNLGANEVNAAKEMEDMVIIRDLNCSGNISYLAKLDKSAALESMEINMETPDNAVKAFQFSTLEGSISSYQGKQRQRQYHPVISQSESLRNSARELSASLKMELKEHGERISAIKTSIARSRSKSRMQTDSEAAPLIKDLFITNLQGSLNEINDYLYMKHAGLSDVNIDAIEVTAAKQMDRFDIVNDLDCSRNSNDLTVFDKNVAVMETVEKGQSEKCIEFCCDSSFKLPHTLDLCASSIDQREAYLKESNKDISSKFELANKEKSSLSPEGYVTSGVDEISSSRDLLDRMSLQPASSLVSPVEKASKGEKLKLSVSSGTSLHHRKTGLDSKGFHVEGLYVNKMLNETSSNRPKKVIDITTLSKSLESSAEKTVQSPNNHPFNKIDPVSPKKSQATVSYFHGLRHQNTESQQETYGGYDVVVGDKRNKQSCHTGNSGNSESCRMQNSPVTLPKVIGDSVILSVDHMNHDEALDIADKAPLKQSTDVFSKLSDSINELLPQSTSELSLQKLDDMENLLDELQTARKYEWLCITLRNTKCSSHPRQKRVSEARYLQEMLGFAKARKQLKCMKLNKLRNKANVLQSQVEECGKLKSIYAQVRDLCRRVVELDEPSYCRRQVHDMMLEEYSRLTAMKEEFGTLEQNIKLLMNSFEASWNLTGKMNCNDFVKAVDQRVMRKTFCREIQQHVQLGKLCDVAMKNGHYEIILGYCNLLFQRFTIQKNGFSSIVANTLSNAANIIKKYPNMNACIAFEFVFKLNVDQKLVNSTCIYEKTVETNLRMGTLIDVLEEILLSRLELLNLIFSTFLKQSSGELELQLCFSSSGRKLILGIEMSNLKCGIYPSDPSELKIRVCEEQTTLPSSIVSKAIDAVRSLQCGHLMLLRLCRCVSQVIQCSS